MITFGEALTFVMMADALVKGQAAQQDTNQAAEQPVSTDRYLASRAKAFELAAIASVPGQSVQALIAKADRIEQYITGQI